HLFGIPQAVKSGSDFWFLVEGYMDVLALSRAGIDHAVAPLGTALTLAQAQLIGRYVDRVVILMDSDRAGREASLRSGEILEKAGLAAQYLFLQEAKDPDDYLNLLGRERLLATLERTYDRTGYLLALLKHDRDQAIGMPASDYRDRAIDLLAAEPDGTRREIYGGQLAKELQISRRAVNEEIERRRGLVNQKEEAGQAGPSSQKDRRQSRSAQEDDQAYELELMLLTLLANQNQLGKLTISFKDKRLSGYALKDDIKAYLTSEAVLAPLSEADFARGKMRAIARLALEDAGDGRLTLASLHSIVDSILEKMKAESEEESPDPSLDPDRIHSMIQKQVQTIEGSRLATEAQERVFLQKLGELRLDNWRRQASRINQKGHELEMDGRDQEANNYYKQAAKLSTAANAFRMIIQGEEYGK
ncbi:MAG TPA: toprim domain-containing protein, partial [Clostridia bacterium]|nr:toprim domain-containing protein [Clostridia bacterium]